MDRHGLQSGGAAVQEEAFVDGAFLMDLLDDTPAEQRRRLLLEDDVDDDDADADDRLSRVMRSLEAEICGGTPAPPAPGAPPSVGELDDMMSDFDGSSSAEFAAPPPATALAMQTSFEYWARAELPPPAAMGHDMGGGWCGVDGDGLAAVAGYEFREPCSYYAYGYNESSHVEQPYSPLWEIDNE